MPPKHWCSNYIPFFFFLKATYKSFFFLQSEVYRSSFLLSTFTHTWELVFSILTQGTFFPQMLFPNIPACRPLPAECHFSSPLLSRHYVSSPEVLARSFSSGSSVSSSFRCILPPSTHKTASLQRLQTCSVYRHSLSAEQGLWHLVWVLPKCGEGINEADSCSGFLSVLVGLGALIVACLS